MKKSHLILPVFFLFFLLQSCAPALEKEIVGLKNQQWDLLELTPGYDFYFMRLDIIRERETFNDPNGIGGSTGPAPYHRLGFHLGNGLFYDLNDNLSLLVPKIYGLEGDDPFSIAEQTSTRRTNRYTRTKDEFIARYGSFLAQTNVTRIERDEEDGALILKTSLVNKNKIYESEDELTLKYTLGKTSIKKDGKGYIVKQLIGRRNYMKYGSEIILDNRYFIKERNNRIEVFAKKTFSNDRKLLLTMIKGEDKIIIYDRRNRGFKLEMEGDKIEYRRNKTLQVIYTKE